MIRKQVFTITEKSSEKEFVELVKTINSSKNKLKILRISSELAKKYIKYIDDSKINYLILKLTDENKTFVEQINELKSSKRILVPEIEITHKNKLLKEIEQIKGIKQIILNYSADSELVNQEGLFAELYAQRIYPLTKNVPFCKTQIENCYELFFKEIGSKELIKHKICENCKLIEYCTADTGMFKPNKSFMTNFNKDILCAFEELQ